MGQESNGMNGVKAEPVDADATEDEHMEDAKVENAVDFNTLRDASLDRGAGHEREHDASPEPMDEG
jgi:COMPASS component SWD3